MKKMITAVAALLMSAATFAQTATTTKPEGAATRQQATPEQRAKRETDNINSLVALGASYDKVLAEITAFNEKRAALKGSMKKGEGPTEDQKAQMKALSEEHKKNLVAAMGKETYDKYEAALKARREERREKAAQNAPAAAPKK